jgi:hypothetical protein
MRVIIDIPKDFETHFNGDRFRDSLCRLAADAGDICGLYEIELAEMLVRAFGDAQVIKDAPPDDTVLKSRYHYSTKAHSIELSDGYQAYEEFCEE